MAPSWSLPLQPRPEAPWEARRLVDEVTKPRYVERIHDDATLLASELVANALRHGVPAPLDAPIRITLMAESSVLRVAVADQGPGFDPHILPSHPDGGGWGLVLVEQLSDRWGVRRRDGATEVWFEMDVNQR